MKKIPDVHETTRIRPQLRTAAGRSVTPAEPQVLSEKGNSRQQMGKSLAEFTSLADKGRKVVGH